MTFTAINALTPSGDATAANSDASSSAHHVLPSPAARGESVASAYLGRGDSDGTESLLSQNSRPVHDSRKRRAATSKETTVKRQKIASIPDLMPSTKSQRIEHKGAAHVQGSAGALQIQAPPPAMYAPSTSMNQLYASPQQTSVEAFRSSTGLSTTIYSCRPTSSSTNGDVRGACSSLNHFAAAGLPVPTQMDRSAVQPQKPERTISGAFHSEAATTVSHERGDGCTSPSVGKCPATVRQSTSPVSECNESSSAIPDAEDDFFGEDDNDFEEVFNLVGRLEAESEAKGNTRSADPDTTAQQPDFESMTTVSAAYNRDDHLTSTSDADLLGLRDSEADEIIELTRAAETTVVLTSSAPSAPNPNSSTREVVIQRQNGGGALLSQADERPLDKLKATSRDGPKPVVRKPFPGPILDRSPLFGVINTTKLRTCFRLGEVLNVGSQAVRARQNVFLELYARVTASRREEKPAHSQHFFFKDLYHNHPPYLAGTFELWQQSKFWDDESKVFLAAKDDAGVMCRVVGKMRRDAERMKWTLEVLSIRKGTWEDVEFVAGIYAREL